MRREIFTLPRGTGALLLFATILAVMLSGLWAFNQATASVFLEIEARKSTLAMLERRLSLPPSRARDIKLDQASFVQGPNYALAANGLQQRIVRDAEDNGARIISTSLDPEDSTQPASARSVTVEIIFEISNDGLQQVLYRLEAGLPFIRVESLKISLAHNDFQTVAASAAGDRLHVDLRASGYFRAAK
jgi:general secretion pathway protein M